MATILRPSWLAYRLTTTSIRFAPCASLPPASRYCSSDSGDQKGADKLASLLSSLKKKQPSADKESVESDNKEEGVRLAQPKAKKPIKRTSGGLPKPKKGLPNAKELEPGVEEAAGQVARMAGDDKGRQRVQSQLLKKLKVVSLEAEEAKKEDGVAGEEISPALGDLLDNLKIEKSKPRVKSLGKDGLQERPWGKAGDEGERAWSRRDAENVRSKQDRQKELTMEQLAFLQKRQKLRRQEAARTETHEPIDLFGGTPFGILTPPSQEGDVAEKSDKELVQMWKSCAERELRILSTPSPRNALEEMILWTKQGKLWQFPVDNEQGLDYSGDPFHKHVFLEHHLHPWCPPSGPIRHFMELVCAGLSKNPYMSSAKKVSTITWFKDYFERDENREILVHAGFWQDKQAQSMS